MTTLALTNLPLAGSWDMHGGWGWGWMLPMMLGMALFWSAIILGFVWLVRDGFAGRHERHAETALTILDRRFAESASPPTTTTSAGTSSRARPRLGLRKASARQ